MSANDAIFWYSSGVGTMMTIGGGPLLLVVLVRWAKSFLGS